MRVFAVLGAIVCALALPTLAFAGGWASVGFEPLPDGMSAGRNLEGDDLRQAARDHAPRGVAARRHDREDRLRRVDGVPRGGR